MNKTGLVLLAVSGILVGGSGLMIAARLRSEVATLKSERLNDQAALSELRSKLEATERKVDRGAVRSVEPGSSFDPPEATRTGQGEGQAKMPEVKPAAGPPSGAPGDAVEDFQELQKKVFDGSATEEEKDRFWKLTRDKPGLLDDIIKQLEKAAAENPRDKEGYRRLSDAYLAKLMAVPDGIQKGTWSNKMISAEKKILEIDPEDWDARFSVATNYSFWPEQFNKRPDAIKEFEILKRIQESRLADPKYAQTYLQLRQLYLKEGRVDDAKAILDEGLRRYPADAELIKAREGAQ